MNMNVAHMKSFMERKINIQFSQIWKIEFNISGLFEQADVWLAIKCFDAANMN